MTLLSLFCEGPVCLFPGGTRGGAGGGRLRLLGFGTGLGGRGAGGSFAWDRFLSLRGGFLNH